MQVELLAVNQNKSRLPQPRVPMFNGNPVEYCSFIQAFENLIESRTQSSIERLYYLEQYSSGDMKELVRSCHHLPPEEGYVEACRLLLCTFGDEYRIASAYESKVLAWPQVKPEDGSALSKFAIFLSSCKNALGSSLYASKFDQPGNLQKLVFKLPFSMRERWRRSANDIMELQARPVKFDGCALAVYLIIMWQGSALSIKFARSLIALGSILQSFILQAFKKNLRWTLVSEPRALLILKFLMPWPAQSSMLIQSNLDYPDLDYPDFSIIRTFSLVPFFT